MPVDELLPSHTPRQAGEDSDHIRSLAQLDVALPPIIVHRRTMRVVDGMHRLRAAALRDQDTIDVRFFDGNEKDAFVLSVLANIAHGLPLSLADRKASAVRIIASHTHWSDRLIGWITGLSHKTVGAVRRQCVTGENSQSHARMGHDGRVRPLNNAEGRRQAGDLMRRDPTASLRDIAKVTGVSTSTVRDVRDRLRRGENPVPIGQVRAEVPKQRTALDDQPGDAVRAGPTSGTTTAGAAPTEDELTVMRTLRNDPTLRFSETGRSLLRWLDASMRGAKECEQLAEKIPTHCATAIARMAMVNAYSWREFARHLELRHRA